MFRPAKRARLESLDHSHLAHRLLSRVGSGELRPTTAQQTALDAVHDGIASQAVHALASLGNAGRPLRWKVQWPIVLCCRCDLGAAVHHPQQAPCGTGGMQQFFPVVWTLPCMPPPWLAHMARSAQNIERDLHVWLRNLHGRDLEPYVACLPLWDGDSVREIEVPLLLPHQWLSALHSSSPSNFQASLVGSGGMEGIPQFWGWMMEQPWAAHHPAYRAPEDLWQHIPFCIHCDGGEAYSNYELEIWSLSSLLVHGLESWDWKFVLCTIPVWRMPSKEVRNVAASTACLPSAHSPRAVATDAPPCAAPRARSHGAHGFACMQLDWSRTVHLGSAPDARGACSTHGA